MEGRGLADGSSQIEGGDDTVSGYEYRRFAPGESHVSTFDFHQHRERAPHLEQGIHRQRLETAAEFVAQLAVGHAQFDVVDLGCGDGGLLQLLRQQANVHAVGFDFQPSNAVGWVERGVNAHAMNFVKDWIAVPDADAYVMTEVLEHLEDPHGMLHNVAKRYPRGIVCSSPWMEHEGNIDACHAWAWDMPGYISMIEDAGFKVTQSRRVDIFQVHLAVLA